MTTYIIFTSTGGQIGRIHWRNAEPLKTRHPGTLWGTVWWNLFWPAKPEDAFSERVRRIGESVRRVAQQMSVLMAPMAEASAAVAELGRAYAAAGGVIQSSPSYLVGEKPSVIGCFSKEGGEP